jgi:chemotaxis protein CheX
MASAARQVDPVGIYAQSIDEAVEEVFSLMMGLSCAAAEDFPVNDPGTISAVIGLAGSMSGTCLLCGGERTAVRMAGALTGMEMESLDNTVKDAIGEICNMIAGAWKGKLPALASSCMLSTPTVVSGTNYQLHTQRPEFRVERCYRFEDYLFSFTVVCESMQ